MVRLHAIVCPATCLHLLRRKDEADLAQRLQEDLKDNGYDAWLDKQRIEGGASWTNTIEEAIDNADYLLALLTQGSYVSEI